MSKSQQRVEVERLIRSVVPGSVEFCWCGDPFVVFDRPVCIHLTDEGSDMYVKQIALHEAAHVLRGRGGHERGFWGLFETLVSERLADAPLTTHQQHMKSDYLRAPPVEQEVKRD